MSDETAPAAVIGAGPAGLAAAEVLARAGVPTTIFEARPSAARKFLMAGKSGLNLTKDEPPDVFTRAIDRAPLAPMLAAFGPDEIRAWAGDLGEPLFTGTSGRVFPRAMKGSPLLRKWMARLAAGGVDLRTRWSWQGWQGSALAFQTPDGSARVRAGVTILALGGASWPRLGSDAAWVPWLVQRGVPITPFEPANMGFDVGWSDHFVDRFAGAPVKPVALSVGDQRVQGEFVITRTGIEGSLVYAVSKRLREALKAGQGGLRADLLPGLELDTVIGRLARPRGKASLSNHLRKTLGLSGVRAGMLRDCAHSLPAEPESLARLIKALPVPVTRPRPLAEAISSAGGIAWEGVDGDLGLKAIPNVYVAGEMLDWEAPTGGYLLTASISTGRWAGAAAARSLGRREFV